MKPQDFFIGIRDFFSVLVPGLALLLIFPQIGQLLNEQLQWALPKAGAGALAFAALLASYGLGMLVGAAASLLDRYVDDNLIGNDGRPTTRFLRRVFGLRAASRELLAAQTFAEDMERKVLAAGSNAPAVRPWTAKAFWWNYMRVRCPTAVEELDRIEGHQKLFRALGPVALLAAAAGHSRSWLFIVLCVAACWAFFGLFIRSRIRFTRRLYEFVAIASLSENALQIAMAVDPAKHSDPTSPAPPS
jgi:hypothetical protein